MLLERGARRTMEYIRRSWELTIREPSGQSPDEVPLPVRFTCPDPAPPFRGFYYWDTYYTSVGLWLSSRDDLARDNADNMLYLLDKMGYVPNYSDKSQLNRSEPPHASLQVRGVYERSHDKGWLAGAYPMLEKEYAFWNSMRLMPCGLNHYYNHASPDDIYRFAANVRKRQHPAPENPIERMRYLMNIIAEAESGWDYTPRFDHRCTDFAPIDLNALLYMHERNCEHFARELGRDADAKRWSDRAEKHRQLIREHCWGEREGCYFDYDAPNRRTFPLRTPAAFYALWAGLATEEQAARVVANLPAMEREFGLTTCAPDDPAGKREGTYQWDDPNGWAPLHYAAIEGLRNYGHHDHAERIARKWVTAVATTFAETGRVWEKYNVYNGTINGVTTTYPLKPMLGWTAGVFLHACQVLGIEG